MFRLDQAAVVQRVRSAAAHLLAARHDVLEVWLFGSLARGEAAPGSDADLLIVVRDGAAPFLERAHIIARYFQGVGVACDLFVYTRSETETLRRSPSVVKTAMETGRRIQ